MLAYQLVVILRSSPRSTSNQPFRRRPDGFLLTPQHFNCLSRPPRGAHRLVPTWKWKLDSLERPPHGDSPSVGGALQCEVVKVEL